MDADLFLQQFGHLAQGEGGIKKLRDVILQLAVRGKLVEQNPVDEPAEVLLKSILKKKEAILGKSKVKNLHRSLANETTHELPSSWVHTTLDELGVINPRNDCDGDTVVGFVPMTLVSEGYGVFPRYEEKTWSEISKGYTHFANDDVGLAKITPCFENSKSCVFRDLTNGIGAGTTELHIFRDVTKTIVPAYVWIWIKSPEFLLEGARRMTGSAGQKRVPKDYFALKPFPLPPLAEQKRIVAKVDELMVLCDKLEAEQKAQRTLKTQAVQSTLHHLTNAESPASFGTSLNILERTFDNWFDDLATVKHLRATILQLAVQGKLTSNTATSNLWPVKRLQDVAAAIVDCPHSTPKWTVDGKICVRTSQFRPGNLDLRDTRYVSEETFIERIQRLEPRKDDILYSREGGILGVACRVPPNVSLCLGQRMMLIRAGDKIDPVFLELVLNSPLITEIARNKTTGGAAPRVNVSTVKDYPIPLPPLAEQKRIVAKVDELMTLCDQLEAHINHTQTTGTHLMDSLIHRMTAAA